MESGHDQTQSPALVIGDNSKTSQALFILIRDNSKTSLVIFIVIMSLLTKKKQFSKNCDDKEASYKKKSNNIHYSKNLCMYH